MHTRVVSLIATLALAILTFGVAPALAHSPADSSQSEIVVDWRVMEDSGTGFLVSATVHNHTDALMTGWTIEAPYRHAVTQIDGGVSVQDDSTVTISGDQKIATGGSHLVEMTVSSAGPVSRVPSTCSSPGEVCRVVVPGDSIDPDHTEAAEGVDTSQTEAPQSSQADDEATAEPTPIVSDSESVPRELEPDSQTPPPTEDRSVAAEPEDHPGVADPLKPPTDPQTSDDLPAETSGEPGVPDSVSLSVAVVVTSDWGSGQSVKVTVRNDGPDSIDEWSIALPWEISVDSMWNAQSTSGGGVVRASNEEWNGHLEPGQAIEIGFNGSPGASVFAEGACYGLTNHGSAACQMLR